MNVDGYTTYDNWEICIDYRPLAICAEDALPFILSGGILVPVYS